MAATPTVSTLIPGVHATVTVVLLKYVRAIPCPAGPAKRRTPCTTSHTTSGDAISPPPGFSALPAPAKNGHPEMGAGLPSPPVTADDTPPAENPSGPAD
jgi:hypothetical protein